MRKVLMYAGLVVVVVGALPLLALAADLPGLSGPIVTGDLGGPFLDGCDILKLANNIIQFGVYASVIVSTLMFTWAGILYVTAAANKGNLEKARGIFWKVFIGLIIVLSAWLIVDTIMKVFVGDTGRLGVWNTLDCSSSTNGGSNTGGNQPGSVTPTTGNNGPTLTDAEARKQLTEAGIGIESSGNCSNQDQTNCTSLEGIPQSTVTKLINLKQQCEKSGGTCNITVTGGTEAGHQTHGSGRPAVDIRFDQKTADYIYAHRAELGIKQICTTAANSKYRYMCTTNESQNHLHLGF